MKNHVKPAALMLLVLAALFLSSCDFFMGLFNPLVGSWSGDMATLSAPTSPYASGTFAIHGDGSFEFTMSPTSGSGGTGSGTFSSDANSKTATFTFTALTFSGGPTVNTPYAMSYELTSSNAHLTLQSSALNAIWELDRQ
jgi:hypothetical protein